MASFFRNALGALNRIYKFQGGTVATNQIELGGPIQLVHNVSREAELAGPGYFGLMNFSISNLHAVGGDQVQGTMATVPTAAFWATQAVTPETHWLWLLEASVRIASGVNFSNGFLVIDQTAPPPFGLTDHQRMTHFWSATAGPGAAAILLSRTFATRNNDPRQVLLPCIVPDNATFVFDSTTIAGAADVVVCQLQCALLPKGVGPRGLA